jgi:1,4-dihydroxy-2-naphthoyl-CoA synthase
MGMMNQVVKLPQLNKVMMTMSREMEKAGLIEVWLL